MANADSLSGVRKWLGREEWREPFDELIERHLEAPCAAAGVELDELDRIVGDDAVAQLFGCVFEDMLASELENGRNIVDDYLKRRGWKESVPNKRYMTALRASVMSLYEVSDIVRDQSFLARDLLRGGEPVRISERLATRSMKPWDWVAARFVRLGPRTEMTGGVLPLRREMGEIVRDGFLALRQEMHAEIRELARERLGDTELEPFALDTEILRRAAFLFTNAWLNDALQHALHPELPTLLNGDGDKIEWTTVRYPLKAGTDREALEKELTAIAAFRPADDDRWDWIGPPHTPACGKDLPEGAENRVTSLPHGSVLLGHVALEPDTLRVEANSPQRADKARALLDPVIRRFAGEPVVESATVEEMMARQPAGGEPPTSSGLSPEEERAIVHEALERHYRALLDQPVPALGNISPRKAAGTKEGRENLVGWLKYLENANGQQEPGSPIASYDVSWMWQELGVADLRR